MSKINKLLFLRQQKRKEKRKERKREKNTRSKPPLNV